MDKLGIRPLGDRVVIERLDIRTTEAGVYIPENTSDKSQKGIVVAVGPGKLENGKLQSLTIKFGDTIIFGKYSGTEVSIKGKEYLIMREEDIIGIVD